MDTIYDVLVIGAGQSGLATGYYLQRTPLTFAILDKQSQIGGAWTHYYDSLKLFSPAKYASLPGMDFLGDPDHYPPRNEVIAYLRDYADHFDLPVISDVHVTTVERDGDVFALHTTTGERYFTRALIAASGPFNTPKIPTIMGMESFNGEILHSFDYKNPAPYHEQHVVVVGARESAMQIAADLAPVARVTMAVRRPLKFMPQHILGKDIHFWLHSTGYDQLPLGLFTELEGTERIIEAGPYREMLAQGNPTTREMFERFTDNGVVWSDGEVENVDAVIFATGYKQGLDYLADLGALDAEGRACHRGGVSERVAGLYFVGLFGQRSHASATLRGVGKDARYIVNQVTAYLDAHPVKTIPQTVTR